MEQPHAPSPNAIRQEIQRRRFSPAMKRALARVLQGESYRQAAEAEGVGWRDVHLNAGTVEGLREAHLKAWRASWGETLPPMWEHHLERAEQDAGDAEESDAA